MRTQADIRHVLILGGGLAAAAGCFAVLAPAPDVRRAAAGYVHPVAALAWTAANCADAPLLDRTIPRLQAEDLFEMDALLHERAQKIGREVVCAEASRIAARVAASSYRPERNRPERNRQTEMALHSNAD